MALSVSLGNLPVASGTWTDFKATVTSKVMALQYTSGTGIYAIYALEQGLAYSCTIWTGAVPPSVIAGGYSQAQNDSDKSDFETNWKPYANMPLSAGQFNDPRLIYRFGNLTAASTNEVLVSARPYIEQASQAQRSVKSSSNQDAPAGTGAVAVRIVYLDSNYVQHTEDITLSGTTRISTVGTDIRFIEDFYVLQGTFAAGTISLLDATGGAQNEFCGINAATTSAFLCHHYVPAGKRAWITRWNAEVDDETKFKLIGQKRDDGTHLVDQILDLDNLMNGNATPPNRIFFDRTLSDVVVPEKTYIRITTVPNQATSTTIRSNLLIWEIPA